MILVLVKEGSNCCSRLVLYRSSDDDQWNSDSGNSDYRSDASPFFTDAIAQWTFFSIAPLDFSYLVVTDDEIGFKIYFTHLKLLIINTIDESIVSFSTIKLDSHIGPNSDLRDLCEDLIGLGVGRRWLWLLTEDLRKHRCNEKHAE